MGARAPWLHSPHAPPSRLAVCTEKFRMVTGRVPGPWLAQRTGVMVPVFWTFQSYEPSAKIWEASFKIDEMSLFSLSDPTGWCLESQSREDGLLSCKSKFCQHNCLWQWAETSLTLAPHPRPNGPTECCGQGSVQWPSWKGQSRGHCWFYRLRGSLRYLHQIGLVPLGLNEQNLPEAWRRLRRRGCPLLGSPSFQQLLLENSKVSVNLSCSLWKWDHVWWPAYYLLWELFGFRKEVCCDFHQSCRDPWEFSSSKIFAIDSMRKRC